MPGNRHLTEDAELSFLAEPPIIIAEIGNNHGGNLGLAKQMVEAALRAGTPFVKFQTMVPERLLSRDDPAFAEFSRETLSFDDFRELHRFCRDKGAVFLSTPFDPESADLLEELDVPAFKIASGDLTYLPFLRHVAAKHRPILLSTGASSLDEIDAAVNTIRAMTDAELILLHCTAVYPCPEEEVNLAVIPALAERYRCRTGFSDHTAGVEIALASVALGAVAVEKHFTIDRDLPGGDNAISILPEEMGILNAAAKRVWKAIGSPERQVTASELGKVGRMRRSLVARRDLASGQMVQASDLDGLRPGGGLPPAGIDGLIGKRLLSDVRKGEALRPEHFELSPAGSIR